MIDCKLICSDVDRTLVTQDLKLPDENRKWVRKVVEEKHIPFAIVSGRFRGSVEPVIKELGVSAIKCCFNGNFIQMGEEVLYDKPMDTDVVRKMLRYTRKAGMAVNSNPETRVVSELINKGADINARDYQGHSVLEYAKSQKRTYIVNELKKLGAN